MVLAKILIVSIFAGVSLSFAAQTSSDTPQVGYVSILFNLLLPSLVERTQGWIFVISIVITISSIFGLAKFFTRVYEQKLFGIVTSLLGVIGSFLIFTSNQENISFVILGFGFWIIGGALVLSRRKEKKLEK